MKRHSHSNSTNFGSWNSHSTNFESWFDELRHITRLHVPFAVLTFDCQKLCAGSWKRLRRSYRGCRSWYYVFNKVLVLMHWWSWTLLSQLLSLLMKVLPRPPWTGSRAYLHLLIYCALSLHSPLVSIKFCLVLSSCHTAYVLYYCNTVGWTWWDWSLILEHLPSVLWHCWLGHVTRKNPSPMQPIMCLVGR